jgi:uncharacterized protein YqhQ
LKQCQIGGQGVMEGVMMRSQQKSALAVRAKQGNIVTKKWDNKTRKGGFLTWPVIRGCVNLVDMMAGGIKVISDSARMSDSVDMEGYEPNKFEKFVAKKTGKDAMDIMMIFAVILGIGLAVGLFFILPTVITNFIKGSIESSFVINLIDGLIRILIFLGYMALVTFSKDIRRVFMYHGAEHKTIACYEHDEELNVENVRKHRRLHPRCGTSYLLLVMILTILVYACLGWNDNWVLRFSTRIILLPVIAGLSYEFLKLLAKCGNVFCRALRWPGLQLQRLTTKEPDDGMIEVAIVAFEMALEEKDHEQIQDMITSFDRAVKTLEPQSA